MEIIMNNFLIITTFILLGILTNIWHKAVKNDCPNHDLQ